MEPTPIDPASEAIRWVAVLSGRDAAAMHILRGLPGVQIADTVAGDIWLRGPLGADGRPPVELVSVAWRGLWRDLGDGRLCESVSAVPSRRLPELFWRPLEELSRPTLSSSAVPATLETRCPIRLIPDPSPLEPSVLRASLEAFHAWVTTAPVIRLSPLRFAVSDRGEVVVCGAPIPSIHGQRYHRLGEIIACPLGWQVDPPVPEPVLKHTLGLNPGDLALLSRDGTVDHIANACLMPVSRAAVRLTVAGLEESPVESLQEE